MLSFALHAGIIFNLNVGSKISEEIRKMAYSAEVINVEVINKDFTKIKREHQFQRESLKTTHSNNDKNFKGFSSAKLIGDLDIGYPRVSRYLKEEGVVILEVNVSKSGNALEVRIAKSSGYERLDLYAKKKVKKAKFTPSTFDINNGHIQYKEDQIRVKISFMLNNYNLPK